jgi:flagellum-specific peptidoglycan hydrolase FlgJ
VKNFVCFLILAGAVVLAAQGFKDINAKHTKGASAKVTLNSVVTRSHPSGPGGQDQLQGRPTIEASFINRILATASSPAAGTGQAIYDLGVKYGIDPAYALAFFMHESSFGKTGVANATQSLGNIRCSAGYSCIDGFRAYPTWQDGYENWYSLIKYGYFTGQVSRKCPCITVQQIIPVYAPASDHNDERAYIAAIRNAVSTWRAGEVRI